MAEGQVLFGLLHGSALFTLWQYTTYTTTTPLGNITHSHKRKTPCIGGVKLISLDLQSLINISRVCKTKLMYNRYCHKVIPVPRHRLRWFYFYIMDQYIYIVKLSNSDRKDSNIVHLLKNFRLPKHDISSTLFSMTCHVT